MTDRQSDEARAAIASHRLWYHTMELAPGQVTPGWFDLRPVVDSLPWPEVAGKRCLDVGPWDGFFAFELERRGAAEVVAAEIPDHTQWDWSVADRKLGPAVMAEMAGEAPGGGFAIARELLGSRVERVEMNVYDLAPANIGTFDVVVCGSLLLHLRDPIRALESIRSVCSGQFLSNETINLRLSVLNRRQPTARVRGGSKAQWWVPNAAGHQVMLGAAGFVIERTTRPYSIPFGPSHPQHRFQRPYLPRIAIRALTGRSGIPHAAVLARPD